MKNNRIKITVILFILILFAMLFTNCAAKTIRDKNIQSIDVKLYEVFSSGSTGERYADKLMPGKQYRIKVVVFTEDDKITDPDFDDIGFNCPNNTLTNVNRVNNRTIYVNANPESFEFADGRQFTLRLKVINNPYENEYTWGVDWSGYNAVDLSGKDGSSGRDGSGGRYGSNGTNGGNGGNGGQGGNGTSGDNGEDGEDAVFDMAYYEVGDAIPDAVNGKMLVYYDRVNQKLYLTRPQKVLIDTSGGNGGQGGDGGDGGDGGNGDLESESDTYGGNGGNGGNGGDGGDAGEGGNVIIYHHDEFEVLRYIEINAQGGYAGSGGSPGSGGKAGRGSAGSGNSGSDGNAGRTGRAGKDGVISYKAVTDMDKLFVGADGLHSNFDHSKLSN